jgi:hypothetical protein
MGKTPPSSEPGDKKTQKLPNVSETLSYFHFTDEVIINPDTFERYQLIKNSRLTKLAEGINKSDIGAGVESWVLPEGCKYSGISGLGSNTLYIRSFYPELLFELWKIQFDW